jgi:hypothetical protein
MPDDGARDDAGRARAHGVHVSGVTLWRGTSAKHISCAQVLGNHPLGSGRVPAPDPSERAMQSLRELISRVRSWQGWRLLRRAPAPPPPAALPFLVTMTQRPIYREVTSQGVRVYSLCGSCGAQLAASATLCESCAQRRSRSAPNA